MLDAGPLGKITHPRRNVEAKRWVVRLADSGTIVSIPEISDYEVRRELLRAGKIASVAPLDALKETLHYVPLTTACMLRAAEFWAEARREGRPTADPQALDVDVILAAQATTAAGEDDEVVIATTNVGHLSRFVAAQDWQEIG